MLGAVHLGLIAIVVDDYDSAIGFFTGALGFELTENPAAGVPLRDVQIAVRHAGPGTADGAASPEPDQS